MRPVLISLVAGALLASVVGDGQAQEPALPEQPVWKNRPPDSELKPGRLGRGPEGQIILDQRPRQLVVCPRNSNARDCQYRSISGALAHAYPTDTIALKPGVYHQGAVVDVPNITITGQRGAHLVGVAVEGKAALVIKADDVIIDGVECSNISVADRNGACIRIEGRNLALRNVYFHNNEEGILGGVGGTVSIENSRLEHNGYGGLAHGVYISQYVDTFIFRNNRIMGTKGKGHDLKSRAQKTVIENNVFASLDSTNSRAIDLPNGGEVVIRGNIFQKGPNSDNWDMIGLTLEAQNTGLNSVNRTLIEDNIFIFDRPTGMVLRSRSPGAITFRGNTVIGSDSVGVLTRGSDNRFFDSRRSANIPPYPALPSQVSVLRREQ